jgi:arylsulfatase A-like enzyme
VASAYFGESLAVAVAAGEHDARAAALSYVAGRSGDIIVVPRPYWFYVTEDGTAQPGSATSHGTLYDYDQHVPVILFGAGIARGEHWRAVTPADLAPTLAGLVGVTLPRPDGHVLADALAAAPAAPTGPSGSPTATRK